MKYLGSEVRFCLLNMFLLVGLAGVAQNNTKIVYEYDEAGNRILRTLMTNIVRNDPDSLQTPLALDSSMVALALNGEANEQADTLGQNKAANAEEQRKDDVFKNKLIGGAIAIYPNPTQGRLTIGLELKEPPGLFELTVINPIGAVVYKSNNYQMIHQLDLTGLANGMYHINVIIDQSSKYYAVIKQ